MTLALKACFVVLGTVGLVWVSRAALRHPGSHGVFRFLAWEAILIGAVLNLDVWFKDPFSWHQILSWVLLTACIWPVVHGAWTLHRQGRLDRDRSDPSLVGIEKTTELVTSGAYRFIRHPLYCSLLLLAWGVFFKRPDWIGGVLAVLASLFLVLTAKIEETENIEFFGLAYALYMGRSRMFIPYLF
jgi:protein-S-isoprenylcysteine O-methyltransferase Ste14